MWKCKEWWNIQLTLGIGCGPLSQHHMSPARHHQHLLIVSSETINQKKGKNPEMRFSSHQIVSYYLGLHKENPGLREVDLEPSSRRGTNTTKTLVSIYWLSRSFHSKERPNQISHKSTKVDPIKSSQTWKKSDQISNFYPLQHMKTFFRKNARSTNAHDLGYKWGCHS